jgi:hypothetical protein
MWCSARLCYWFCIKIERDFTIRWLPSGMWRCVFWCKCTDVAGEPAASIARLDGLELKPHSYIKWETD